MTRTEQKQALKDIFTDLTDLKKQIESNEENINRIIEKIEDLENELSEFGDVDTWDSWQLKVNTIQAYINSTEFESIEESLIDFKNELEEYMCDISESKREKLEEIYSDLDTAIGVFDEIMECEDLEMVKDKIDEILDYLTGMK